MAIIDFKEKYIIDNKGEIIKKKEKNDIEALPVILGLDFSDIGGKVKKNSVFDSVLDILSGKNNCEKIFSKKEIEKIHIDTELGLTISATGRIKTIKLGKGNLALKCEKLEEALSFFDKRITDKKGLSTENGFSEIEFADARNSNQIVIKPGNDKP